ncbi:MAG: hypothetical protein SWH54_06185 [Thermodesulfobacteriota bacterium]|nr:hypothetical protein [Thermodesulfobacteriota bacterium]
MDKKYIKVYIISFYNILLSSLFLIGSFVWIVFPKITGIGEEVFKLSYFLFLLFYLFYFFSALLYLAHKKIGRVSLFLSSIIQVANAVFYIFTTYKTTSTFQYTDIIMIIFGLWGMWFLSRREAIEWLKAAK